MECPECGAELMFQGAYGLFASHQSGEKVGDIFKCPNADGFDNEAQARKYDPEHEGNWEDILCWSTCNSVSGSFYTDRNDELHEGYPC